MKNNGKSIWKITVSVFTVLMILTLLSAGASAKISVTRLLLVQELLQRQPVYPARKLSY